MNNMRCYIDAVLQPKRQSAKLLQSVMDICRATHYSHKDKVTLVFSDTGMILDICHAYEGTAYVYSVTIVELGTADITKPGHMLWCPRKGV